MQVLINGSESQLLLRGTKRDGLIGPRSMLRRYTSKSHESFEETCETRGRQVDVTREKGTIREDFKMTVSRPSRAGPKP